ncbi:MAG TPA: SCO1664 family protein [Actinomycetota bacterium]|nr:SCO1664 family protein [Actinomycetota bacterium]
MPGDERSRPPVDLTEDALALLAAGELEVLGLLPRSSNGTFLVRVREGRAETLAVYKPRALEAPLWDFPEGTLCNREAAAYLVARALGWPWVPPTTLRDGPEGPGSVQLFVPFDPTQHYFTLQGRLPDAFRRIALFDLVVNNADRKAGHCLLSEDGRVFVIDHGVCFHEQPKLRTVIWEFAGEPVPRTLLEDLEGLADELRFGRLPDALTDLLSAAERAAMSRRLERLLSVRRFPEPGPGRPFPWPPV